MLHITNGDAGLQSILAAGISGTIIPWRDVLHEGPVPAGLTLDALRPERARFIAGCGWATYDQVLADFEQRDATLAGFRPHGETVLWFEHDLYDQLQMLQLLDWFAGQDLSGVRLTLVSAAEYLGPAQPERLAELFRLRHVVTNGELQLSQVAWQAFCSPDPSAIADLLRGETAALPFLRAALARHLQQFPAAQNGLSRSEQQALAALAGGSRTLTQAFLSSQADDELRFLGDSIFAWYLQRLSGTEHPLVVWADGDRLAPPGRLIGHDEFRTRPLVITDLGRAVLDGKADWIALAGIDRWLGGAHLTAANHWRWDEPAGQLQHRAAQ